MARIPNNANLVRLVSSALRQDGTPHIGELLRIAAESLGSFACIIWALDEGAEPSADPPRGRLFMLAQWFEDGRVWAFDDLPLNSAAGRAVLTQEPVNITHPGSDPRVDSHHPLFREAGIQTLCSLPMMLADNDRCAINFLRNVADPFSEEDIAHGVEISRLLPALYQAIRNQTSFALSLEIDSLLQGRPPEETEEEQAQARQIHETLNAVAKRIAGSLHCSETTIFLEDRIERPGLYKAVATTWDTLFPQHDYEANSSEGLTGWVLANAQPVRILDLWHFHRDQSSYQARYPNIQWKNFLRIDEKQFRTIPHLKQTGTLLPLSFLAVPILLGEKVIGAIRCSVATANPNYFSAHEQAELKLIAARIASFWNDWLKQRELSIESQSWRAMVKSIADMNRVAAVEEATERPSEIRLFKAALELAKKVIPESDLFDISLLDESGQHRILVATNWEGAKPAPAIENNRFTLTGLAVQVVQTGKVLKWVEDDGLDIPAFQGVKSMILAPIKSGKTVFGILAVRALVPKEFSHQASMVLELLGEQLGLYHSLFQTVAKLLKTELELKETVRVQSQTFEDFQHQLRSPLVLAHRRSRGLAQFDAIARENPLRKQVIAIRGLTRKAVRVSNNIGVFANLTSGSPIKVHASLLVPDELLRMLRDAASDTEATAVNQNLTFHVRRGGAYVLNEIRVSTDQNLLEQAILNILDNAAKYSYAGTTIEIYCGVTSSRRFHISVINRGFKLTAQEARQAGSRGWRSDNARYSTGEGSGIGLWIVDNIMKAHRGEMIVIPSNAAGLVEVKLVFPTDE